MQDSQNGKTVTPSPQSSLTNDGNIIGINGESNELHGDWLLVTRKKKVSNNPPLFTPKNVTPKTNRFTALSSQTQKTKPGPPKHVIQSRSIPNDQIRGPQIPKNTKRLRHDDDLMIEPGIKPSLFPNPKTNTPSVPTQINPKTTYVAKNNTNTSTNQQVFNVPFNHALPERNTPNPEHQHNKNIKNASSQAQADMETNSSNKILCDGTYEEVQDDTNVTEDVHESHDDNEEDMVT
jgi:CDGSH-type Zn-finger protein